SRPRRTHDDATRGSGRRRRWRVDQRSRVIQYWVVGVGRVLNRALTTHSRPAENATVVGTSNSGDVSVRTSRAEPRWAPNRNTSTSLSWLRTTTSREPTTSR